MELPDRAAFAAHQGPGWRLAAGDDVLDVALVVVEALPAYAGGPSAREPFSIEFQTSPGVSLPQGTYRFDHSTLGELSLFVVPVAASDEGLRLQAVFT
jgi:hypothetical protein